MKTRKLKANLARVYPARSGADRTKKYVVRGDSKALHFRKLWAREGDAMSVSYSDILDFAMARHVEWGGQTYIVGLCSDGVWIRQKGTICDRLVSFKDLQSLVNGQGLLPT